MEKNGYIFIKQNFDTLDTDTEPTLTEISEVPVQAISDSALKIGDFSRGNQLLKVNGKMVYLQMENKPATREEILKAAKSKGNGKSKIVTTDAQGKVTVKSGRKMVTKTAYLRKHANVLKGNSVKKVGDDDSGQSQLTVKPVSVPNMVKNVMKCTNPLQLLSMKQEPMGLVQVLPDQLVIPVSMMQMPLGSNVSQVFQSPNIVTLDTSSSQQCIVNASSPSFKITGICNTNTDSALNRNENVFPIGSIKQEIVEIQQVETVDEKGAAGDLSGSSMTSTPIVSDAPWQGVLNINSEQELVEYINSQSNTSVDTEQGYTIFIQNVDPNNGAVLSSTLDSQNLLAGTGMSSVFTDQGNMISDILPVVSNVEEAQAHSSHTEESKILQMLDETVEHIDDDQIKSNNVIEIRTEGDTDNELVGTDKIVKIEIDSEYVEVNNACDVQEEMSVVKINKMVESTSQDDGMHVESHSEHLHDPDQSPDNATGQLLIREDESDSEHLHEVCLSEETVVEEFTHVEKESIQH